MDYVQAILATERLLDRCREKYDFHMAAVRRGSDPDLRDAHLRAAQREYDALELARANHDRLYARALAE